MTESTNTTVRLAFVGVVVIGLFAALFARIWFLQVLATEELRVQADTNQVRLVTVSPTRGRILDRNGTVLADNEFVGVVLVDPNKFESDTERDFVLSELERLTGESVADMTERLGDSAVNPFASRVLVTDLDEQMLQIVAEQALPGVTAEFQATRIYPRIASAAHVLGYIGAQPDGWTDTRETQRYQPNDKVDRAGVEALFEKDLRGTPGTRKVEVDAANTVVRELGEEAAIPGDDVYLSLDIELQEAVEFFLARGLRERSGVLSKDSQFNFPAQDRKSVV